MSNTATKERGEALKSEFTAAYDNAAQRGPAAAATEPQGRGAETAADAKAASTSAMIHRVLMKKMGYDEAQLEYLGDAARFMQGVGNVHPTAAIREGETRRAVWRRDATRIIARRPVRDATRIARPRSLSECACACGEDGGLGRPARISLLPSQSTATATT